MNQDLVRQNKMLQQYVGALQRQNNSRNIQKDVLLRQIDNLNKQNDNLRYQIPNSHKNNTNNYQIETISQQKKLLENQIAEVYVKLQNISKVKNQIDVENSRLKSQINNLNNKLVLQSKTVNNGSQAELSKLKNQNNELKNKNSALLSQQSDIKKLQTLNLDLQNKLVQMEDKYKNQYKINQIKQIQLKRFGDEKIKQQIRRQIQLSKNQQIKIFKNNYEGIIQSKNKIIRQLQSRLNQNQNKMYNTQKNSNYELNQLKATKNQLQNKLKGYQSQRQRLQAKLIQLQTQLNNQTFLISKKQQQLAQLQKIKGAVFRKNQQLTRSSSIIEGLKNNVTNLQRKIQILQGHIQQSKLKDVDYLKNAQILKQKQIKNVQQKYSREIEGLKQQLTNKSISEMYEVGEHKKMLAQKNRQNEELKKIISQLNQNNKHLLEQLRKMQESQQTLIKNLNNSRPDIHRNQQNLRDVVEELKEQLKTVKSQFRRMQEDNRKKGLYQNAKNLQISKIKEPTNYIKYPEQNLNTNKSYKYLQKRSDFSQTIPTNSRDQASRSQVQVFPLYQQDMKFIKVKNQTQKFRINTNQSPKSSQPIQRDKWESLQRRITQLRQQNAQLKNSLYS